jgi:spore coat protein A
MKSEKFFMTGLMALLLCGVAFGQVLLDPTTLTKYIDPLPIPSVLAPAGMLGDEIYYEVTMSQFQQQLHSELPPTTVWGYNGTYPGPTFEAMRNYPVAVKWINNLPYDHLFTIDTMIDGAGSEYPAVRAVVHLHGGDVKSADDGGPLDWYTPGNYKIFHYPNRQLPTTLWYHDHALGITRLNVDAGLAGFYLLRDDWEASLNLPSGAYEIPIVIQDRTFYNDGQLFYPEPPWEPEFFGDVAVVNGKVWPRLVVEPRKYRFRFLNGSNARFYNLKMFEADSYGNPLYDMGEMIPGPAFYQIGSDGGFLSNVVTLNDPYDPYSPRLLFGPAERFDVIIDFAGYNGKYFLLQNNAKAPFKGIDAPEEDEAPLPEIMLFDVKDTTVTDNSVIPLNIMPAVKRHNEYNAVMTRDLTLEEMVDEAGEPMMLMINGKHFYEPVTEKPVLNTTEIWRFINTTEDVHPMHIHLVQFNILDRQPFDVEAYMLDDTLIFTGPPVPPDPNEMGWKDTFRAHPGEVARVIARFDRAGLYVVHCHILEHEDNDMMRPYEVVYPPKPKKWSYAYLKGEQPDAVLGEAVEIVDETDAGQPASFQLLSTYPNPFNLTTQISYSLPVDSDVKLEIYNVTGQKVRTLIDEFQYAGAKSITWDGTNQSGQKVSSGVYFMRLSTVKGNSVLKMTLLK